MVSANFATQFLSILTLLGGIFIVGFLGFLIYNKVLGKKELKLKFLKDNALIFAFLVAFGAIIGSLFYSEIAKYTPCKLCWFQRILMYPLTILLGIALVRKSRDIIYYVIPLSVIGGVISLYHYIIQRSEYVASCSAQGASCASKYIFHFGYITIPMMALTGFVLIIILSYLWKKR